MVATDPLGIRESRKRRKEAGTQALHRQLGSTSGARYLKRSSKARSSYGRGSEVASS